MLPLSGNLSATDIATSIANASSELGVPDTAEVRTVVASDAGGPSNVATTLRIGFADSFEPDQGSVHRAGGILLVGRSAAASAVDSAEELRAFLGSWIHVAGSKATFDPQFPTSVDRNPSDSVWSAAPSWTIAIHDRTQSNSTNGPRGPFYDPKTQFFAESLGAAVLQWTHDAYGRDLTSAANSYRIIINDRRLEV